MAKKKVAEKVKEANPVDQKKQTVTSKNKDGEEEITAHQEPIKIQDLIAAFISSLKEDPDDGSHKKRDELIGSYLKEGLDKYDISKKYNILFLYDEGTMIKSDADFI